MLMARTHRPLVFDSVKLLLSHVSLLELLAARTTILDSHDSRSAGFLGSLLHGFRGDCLGRSVEAQSVFARMCSYLATKVPFARMDDMNQMFAGATKANPNTSNWNTATVTTMEAMFRDAEDAVPNTAKWNTKKVATMTEMFQGATNANPVTSSWNTHKVKDFSKQYSSHFLFVHNHFEF